MRITGKAVLKLTRIDSGSGINRFYFDVDCSLQTCSNSRALDWINEEWWHICYDTLPAPAAAYKLEIGDSITVAVSYEFVYTRGDGWTIDDDVDLYYNREYVLKRTKYNPRSERQRWQKPRIKN